MRASLNPDKARQGGGGIEAGNYAIAAAAFRVIKTDYKPTQPALVLDLEQLDKDGDPVRGADTVSDVVFSLGEKALEAFHPGTVDSADAEDVEDQGSDVNAEGNTLFVAEDGAQLNKSCGAMVLMESLLKLGVPKPILARCYAPDFVGMKFSLATKTGKEINEWLGTRLSTKPTSDGNTVTYKVATKLLNPKHFSNGAGSGATSKKASKGEDSAAADSGRPTDPEDIAKFVLGKVAAAKAGEKNKIKSKAALLGFFTNEYTKAKFDPKSLGKAQGFVKDEDWVVGAVAELGGTYDEGVTVFPEG